MPDAPRPLLVFFTNKKRALYDLLISFKAVLGAVFLKVCVAAMAVKVVLSTDKKEMPGNKRSRLDARVIKSEIL
jgi:hypothetical protein